MKRFDKNFYKMKYLILLFFCFGSSIAKLDRNWWRHTSIYEIVVYAFKDSDGDGIGDIKGITSKVDYLNDLGIETVYLTPCYKSTMYDMGYDIIDYNDIEPVYGTLADIKELIAKLKARGMKLILDLVINHTSFKHPWFLKSVDKVDPYTDYYVWKDASYYSGPENTPVPPNSWRCWHQGETAWEWNEKRKQFYYHAFLPQQVDLDLRNENVKKEIKDILKFWMDLGVSGFRVDAPMNFIEDKYLSYGGQRDQKESFEFMHELRVYLDEYNQKHGGFERIFLAEAHASPELAVVYYGTKDYPINHFPFNYYFGYNKHEIDPTNMNNMIQTWLSYVPKGEIAGWVSDDHDRSRSGSRIRPEYRDINTVVTAMLPGTVHYYYGTEIGLMNGFIKENQIKDKLGDGGRDPFRLIMQWDDSLNSGFSRHIGTYVPSAIDYPRMNAKQEQNKEISHYSLMKNLNRLRKTETLKEGKFLSNVYSLSVYIFWRSLPGHETYIVILNLRDEESEVDLRRVFKNLPKILSIETASVNSGYKNGQTLPSNDNCIIVKPLSAIVLNGVHHLLRRG